MPLVPQDLEVLNRHLAYMRLAGRAPRHVIGRRDLIIRLAEQLPAGAAAATAEDLQLWRAELTVSDESVGRYVSHARCFYTWMIAASLREDNPTAGLPVPPRARRLPRPCGEDDLALAIATAPDRIRPWLVLASFAGFRAKEVALLRRESVLEGATPPVLIIAESATKGRRERIVPLHPFVLSELRSAGLPARGYVFRRRDGQRGPLTPATVSHLANEHLHGCGVTATLHQLRHRFGTQTYRSSHDLRLVQELLGHADPSTTAGYAAYDQPQAAAAVDALTVPTTLRIAQ